MSIGLAMAAAEQRSAREIRSFQTLDGLRGVAACGVAIGHGRFLAGQQPMAEFSECYLAVDFFFVLSGFILAHAYGARLSQGLSVRRFMALRLIRLYPLYGLALLCSFGLAALQGFRSALGVPLQPVDALAALLMLPDPHWGVPLYPLNIADLLYPLNVPAWSLLFELVANAVLALFWRRLSPAGLAALAGASALVLAVALEARWLGFGTQGDAFNAGALWSSFGGGLVRVVFSFFTGVLVYELWRRRPPRLQVPPVVLMLMLAAMLAVVPPRAAQDAYDLAATLIMFPAMVYLGAASAPGRFGARLFAWLGGISYGVYVLQQAYYSAIQAAEKGAALSAAGTILAIALLLPLVTIADLAVDRPIRRVLGRLVAGGKAA